MNLDYNQLLKYKPRLRGYLRSMRIPDYVVDDMVQSVIVRVHEKIHTFRKDKGSLTPWIFTIAKNMALDWKRRRSPLHLSGLSEGDYDHPAEYEHPADALQRKQEAENLREALATLPEIYAEVLQTVYYAGHTYNEAADVLGVPAGTVKSRSNKAKLLLREKYLELEQVV